MRYGNRAGMETSTIGTGDAIALGAAVAKHQTFGDAGIQNGDTVPYFVEDGNDWEIGTSPYDSSGPSLTLRTVSESSSAGARLSLSGAAQVYIDAQASFFNADDDYGLITGSTTATDDYGSV